MDRLHVRAVRNQDHGADCADDSLSGSLSNDQGGRNGVFSREPLKNLEKEQKHQIEELHHFSEIAQSYGSIVGESVP